MMNLSKTILFFIVIVSFFTCNNPQKKEKILVEETPKKIEEKVIEKRWDSLKYYNVDTFFDEYGKQNKETKVIIKTEFGSIKIRLFEDTPTHRANFIFLTKIGYFNSTVFYRVAKNFVIQGGNSDKIYTLKQRNKYGNYKLKPEFRKNRTHKYGALAAAREWEENPNKLSTPFEFYIVHKRNGAHHLDNEHTVFGEVISGFDTMDKISKVKVGPDDWPIVDIKMTVEILD